jgi:hypothetical protein
MTNFTQYTDQLDHVDAVALGKSLRLQNKHPSDAVNDPTYEYFSSPDNDPVWIFLNKFQDDMLRGWREEDRRIATDQYDERLGKFKRALPVINQTLLVEHDSNQGHHFPYKIVFIAPDRRSVVGESLSEDDKGTLSVIGHPNNFAVFHKQRQNSAT